MRALRDSFLGQLFLGTIVAAIIVAFALTGTSGGGGSVFSSECAARVGDSCIDPKEYNAALGLVLSVGLNDKAVKQLDLRRKVARGLIEREVLLSAAKELGVETSAKAVDAALLDGHALISLPAEERERLALSLALCVDQGRSCAPGTLGLRALETTKDGKFDLERYQRMIRRTTGRSPSHFKEMQQREHTAERMRQLVTSSVRVSAEEAFLSLERMRSKVTARQLIAQTPWFERFVTRPTAADLAQYKADHQADLTAAVQAEMPKLTPGCPVVRELTVAVSDTRTLEDAQKKATTLALGLRSPEAVDSLIRAESDAPSARYGGRVGCLDKATPGYDELLKAAGALKKVGEVSAPVSSPTGVTLLVLDGIVDEKSGPALAEAVVLYRLTATLLGSNAARAFAEETITRVTAGEPLEAAVTALLDAKLASLDANLKARASADEGRPKTDISSPFSIEQSPLDGVVGDVSPARLVFDMKADGEVTKTPIALREGYAVLQLKEKDLYTRDKFAKDKEEVLPQLLRRKAEQVLADYVSRLIEKSGPVSYDDRYAPSALVDKKLGS